MNLINQHEHVIALGFMSGTSLDGLDAAIIETDGISVRDFGPTLSAKYEAGFRQKLKAAVEVAAATDSPCTDQALIDEFTDLHVQLAQKLSEKCQGEGSKWRNFGLVGMHGHTVVHRPNIGLTQQIGNGEKLAQALSVPVIADLRQNDIQMGGQGAPLAPAYHAALYGTEERPICIVNIGGISNVTWIGSADEELIAFDTGPGNGLIDAWMEMKTGAPIDMNGATASRGKINDRILDRLTRHSYYSAQYPKSLDRSDLSFDEIKSLDVEDGAATLVAYTVQTILSGISICPAIPRKIFVTGGGRHNPEIMNKLRAGAPCDVAPVDDSGWDGDMVEAQAFGFLAVRSAKGMPITFPGTTGAPEPLSGGKLFLPNGKRFT